MPETIKSAFEKVNAQFTAINDAVKEIVEALAGLTDDVAFLNETIVKLQNSPGPISAEDQATLDAGIPVAESTLTKLKDLAAAAKALNALTNRPPVVPPPEA